MPLFILFLTLLLLVFILVLTKFLALSFLESGEPILTIPLLLFSFLFPTKPLLNSTFILDFGGTGVLDWGDL